MRCMFFVQVESSPSFKTSDALPLQYLRPDNSHSGALHNTPFPLLALNPIQENVKEPPAAASAANFIKDLHRVAGVSIYRLIKSYEKPPIFTANAIMSLDSAPDLELKLAAANNTIEGNRNNNKNNPSSTGSLLIGPVVSVT